MFSFFLQKTLLKAVFTGLVLVFLTSVLLVSCKQPGDISDPIDAKQPSITTQPAATTNWNVSTTDSIDLTIAATSPDGGGISYRWYSNSSASNTGGSIMDGETTATLTLSKTDYTFNGNYYFYAVVTNTITNNGDGGTKTATAVSSAATVTVSGGVPPPANAQQPTINTQPTATTNWNVGTTASVNLTVAANVSDGGTLSYQWYSNTSASNTGGSIMTGKTTATLSLSRTDYTANGGYYFYVVVTNTNNNATGTKTANRTSNAATVNVSGGNFVIYSQADMEKIGVASGWTLSENYLLGSDITLTNFTPRGTDAAPFRGTFNGNGKTITLTSFASAAVTANRDIGIFGSVKGASASSKAAIRNLKVQSSVSVTGTAASLFQNIGLVAGYAELAEFDTITLSGNFSYTSDGRIHLGGIAGTINQTGTVIKNNTSSLTMNINPAGSGTPAPVSGGTGQHWIGGFVGLFHNGAGIEKCHNSGNITVDNVARSGGQVYAGGIAGGSYYGMSSSNYSGYIQDSSYTGNITVSNTGNWTFAGGIAGTIVGGSSTAGVNTTRIERCFVTGTVSCENTSAGFPYVGGIVAYNYYGALVSQCYFTGTVIQKGRALGQYTGCIAGYNSQATAPTNSRIEDCWSSGKISVTTYDINNLSGPQLAGATSSRCYVIQIFSDGSYRGATGGDSSCFAINPTAKLTQSDYTVAGWNFNTVWKWNSSTGYPILRWQN